MRKRLLRVYYFAVVFPVMLLTLPLWAFAYWVWTGNDAIQDGGGWLLEKIEQ
jgi:hypothetical protein